MVTVFLVLKYFITNTVTSSTAYYFSVVVEVINLNLKIFFKSTII